MSPSCSATTNMEKEVPRCQKELMVQRLFAIAAPDAKRTSSDAVSCRWPLAARKYIQARAGAPGATSTLSRARKLGESPPCTVPWRSTVWASREVALSST